MTGDGASIEIGIVKAISAPFKLMSFMVLGLAVLLVGRLAVDLWMLAEHADDLPDPGTVVAWELDGAHAAPELLGSSHDRAMAWAEFVTEWLYRKPGLVRPDHGQSEEPGHTLRAVQRGLHAMDDAIEHALAGSQILAIRAAILVAYLPWMAFLYLLAVIDGLVERARRTYGAGRESSTLYHRAKYFQVTLATLAVTAYLWWPTTLDPRSSLVLIPLGCALLARLQAKYYKKYL